MSFRAVVNTLLHRLNYSLERYNRDQLIPKDLPEASLYSSSEDPSRLFRPWNGENFRSRLDRRVTQNTMLSRQKLYFLLQLFITTAGLDGDIMEAGTCSGGSALLLTREADRRRYKKRFWLLDTFAGYQKIDKKSDGEHVELQDCRGKSRDEVASLFNGSLQDIRLVEGLIPATLAEVSTSSLCFVHIDVNLYEPTYASTEFALKHLCKGGVVVFDDYNWPATYGARAAIDEVAAKWNQTVISIPESTQAFLIRS
jgi:O-methyltransferase